MVMEKSLNFMSVSSILSPPLKSTTNIIPLDFVYSCRAANYMGLLNFKSIKSSKKFTSSAALATFEVLRSRIWLVAHFTGHSQFRTYTSLYKALMYNPGLEGLTPSPQHVHDEDIFERLLLLGLGVTDRLAVHHSLTQLPRDVIGHIFVRLPYLEGKKVSLEAI